MNTEVFEWESEYDEQGEIEPTEDGLRLHLPTIDVDGLPTDISISFSVTQAHEFIEALTRALREHHEAYVLAGPSAH